MKKWSCTKCGASFGRRFCIERHIDNPRIHNGNADLTGYEYITKVRSGLLPPPKSAYYVPVKKSPKNSKISRSDVAIGYGDFFLDDWRGRVSEHYEHILSEGNVEDEPANPALHIGYASRWTYLNYFGYKCENCFMIGATYDEKKADSINFGEHFCGGRRQETTPSVRLGVILEGLDKCISDLLFIIVRSLTVNRQLVLVGQTDYSEFGNFRMCADRQSFKEPARSVIFSNSGRVMLSYNQLREYLNTFRNTTNTIHVEHNGEKFQYNVWLGMQF